ncbi:GNAT family N-acetyltransferase [Streptomyces sp. H39-S7]|uniref:GNAT family N-acetyltransferase n=1 Tax=Streptomyces sp. H39-S7 TaxID=3004357 RepID=UPI0022AFE245|nr:GNAT family N-acetyltransferase [Streptomyces sp. H39-S7]MCZ4119067.1 GNAT family N-acetyltransferase [Streptomyces sp. H39-S7]
MGWHTTKDLDAFLTAASGFLRARAVENTVLITVADGLRLRALDVYGDTPPRFGWWHDAEGTVGAAFLETPPWPPLLTQAPVEAVAELADVWGSREDPLLGVRGERATVEAFADAWRSRTGVAAEPGKGIRLFRLGELTPPEPAPAGRARTARADDRELLVEWHEAFAGEIGEPSPNAGAFVDDRLGHGGLTLWEVDGVPVSMAGNTRALAGMVRVVAVYTPPAHRGRGYAGAATAVVSRAARDAGTAEVVLFTDLANPTSNALYRRLGYRPVQDHAAVTYSPAGGR